MPETLYLLAGTSSSLPKMSLEDAASELLAQLCAKHPLGYRPKVVWKNYRVSAGMAFYRIGVIALSRLVLDDEPKMIDTLKHEYAHLMAYAKHGRKGVGHGAPWEEAMVELGLEVRVQHNYPVQRNRQRQQVAYTCQRCGVLLVRAKRLPKRRRYSHVGCGGSIKYTWTREVTHAMADA